MDWFANKEIAQLGNAGAGLTLPVRLALGHSYFEAIHPFTDGLLGQHAPLSLRLC